MDEIAETTIDRSKREIQVKTVLRSIATGRGRPVNAGRIYADLMSLPRDDRPNGEEACRQLLDELVTAQLIGIRNIIGPRLEQRWYGPVSDPDKLLTRDELERELERRRS